MMTQEAREPFIGKYSIQDRTCCTKTALRRLVIFMNSCNVFFDCSFCIYDFETYGTAKWYGFVMNCCKMSIKFTFRTELVAQKLH